MRSCCRASLYADNCSFYGPILTFGFFKGCPDIQGIVSHGDVVLQERTMRGNLWVSKNITIEKSVVRGYIKFEGECLMANLSEKYDDLFHNAHKIPRNSIWFIG
ncbi:hypothetical protein ACTFIR_005690 [Dictyostelium discoideum]